jgi:YggT family protein
VSAVGVVLYQVLFLFLILLLVRVVMETVMSFARSYEPHGFALVVLEATFTVTDPPVKGLRRVIPPLRLGQIALDLAVPALFLILIVLMQVATRI